MKLSDADEFRYGAFISYSHASEQASALFNYDALKDVLVKITHPDERVDKRQRFLVDAPGSARVSRVGFGVPPKQSSRDRLAAGEVRDSETPEPTRETHALPEERDSGHVGFGTFILHPAFGKLPL